MSQSILLQACDDLGFYCRRSSRTKPVRVLALRDLPITCFNLAATSVLKSGKLLLVESGSGIRTCNVLVKDNGAAPLIARRIRFKRERYFKPVFAEIHRLSFLDSFLHIEQILANPNSTIPILPSDLNKLNHYCRRRAQRLPVQYILGQWGFHGIPLKMCPPVFIPRPETEGLVDIVLSHINRSENDVRHVLDIGCGTGSICLSLASCTPKVHYTAIDRSLESVKLTQENSSQLGLSERVSCYLAEATPNGLKCSKLNLNTPYDAIVSNPPYIAIQESSTIEPEVLKYEDHTALFAGPDGLDVVRSILQLSRRLLRVGGHLFLEVGLSHPPLIRAMLAAEEHSHLLELVAVHPDFSSRPRFVEIKRIQ